jgi:hypothetical protein
MPTILSEYSARNAKHHHGQAPTTCLATLAAEVLPACAAAGSAPSTAESLRTNNQLLRCTFAEQQGVRRSRDASLCSNAHLPAHTPSLPCRHQQSAPPGKLLIATQGHPNMATRRSSNTIRQQARTVTQCMPLRRLKQPTRCAADICRRARELPHAKASRSTLERTPTKDLAYINKEALQTAQHRKSAVEECGLERWPSPSTVCMRTCHRSTFAGAV